VPRFNLPLLRSLTGKSTASATIAEQSDLRLTRRSFLGVSGRGLSVVERSTIPSQTGILATPRWGQTSSTRWQ
jgi:hypothetical protein